MLRWVVLVLLLSNGIYFAWQKYLSPAAVATAQIVVEPQGQRVALLNEAVGVSRPPSQAVVQKPATPTIAAANTAAALPASQPISQPMVLSVAPEVPAAPICHMIGPFHERISARQVRDRLSAMPIRTDLYQINIPAKPVFWVYLGPLRSRQEAQDQHRQLLEKNIESFIITEGPLLNGVSLGFFTLPDSAQALLRQRREQGYDAKLREVPRTTAELWLLLAEGEHNRFSSADWEQVRAGTQGIELRKSLCDAIASAEKLE
jgi:hypothetical protein